jgi:plasmid stabilization system protein ParE
MQIIFSDRANKDIENIYAYFFEVAPHKADEIVLDIVLKTEQLLTHPYSGPEELSLKSMGFDYRFLVQGNYKIIYSVLHDTIFIIQVFDARQDPTKLFTNE